MEKVPPKMDKMTSGGKATNKRCDFIGLFFTKRTNFIFDFFLTNDYTMCKSGGSNKQRLFSPTRKINKDPTCRRITDKILRVASCISLSRAIAKESTYNSARTHTYTHDVQYILQWLERVCYKDYDIYLI